MGVEEHDGRGDGVTDPGIPAKCAGSDGVTNPWIQTDSVRKTTLHTHTHTVFCDESLCGLAALRETIRFAGNKKSDAFVKKIKIDAEILIFDTLKGGRAGFQTGVQAPPPTP